MSEAVRSTTVLVTGGAGFMGAHVARALISRNDVRVVALDDLSGGFRENVPEGADFIEGSVTDADLLSSLFAEHRFRYVYHLAAYAAEGLSHFIRRFNYINNVVGSVNVINESVKHDVQCLVFTSSIAAYGDVAAPMREDQRPQPEDPYGIAKLAVEMDLEAAHRMFGLPYVIFRPHNVYGELQNLGDPYRNVVGIFMNQMMKDVPLTVFGDGEQKRAFSYIQDVAPVIARSPWVAEARQQVFNIGADHVYTVNELALAVAEAMGRRDYPIEHLPERNEVKVAFSDHAKARSVFGEDPQTSLRDGLSRMATWAREFGSRKAKPFEHIEIRRKLPERWQSLFR